MLVGMDNKRPLSWKRESLRLVCLLMALGLFCGLAARVLTPKRHDYGAVWGMYQEEPKDSLDVLVLGSSLAYCDVIPSVLYEEAGLASFVMAGPQQTLPVTYYYLRQALRTQSPQTVLLEVTGAYFDPDNRHLKANLALMPYGPDRWLATLSETRGTQRLGLLFPLYAYHDRWDELTQEDLTQGLFGQGTDPLAGYTFLDEATPIQGLSVREDLDGDPEHFARAMDYLGRIRDLCADRDVRLVCFLSPAPQRMDGEKRERLAAALEDMGLSLWDLNDRFDDFGFDLSQDFYDPRHLNYRGAEKFSRGLAGLLAEWGAAPAGKGDAALWEQRSLAFARRKADADAAPLRLNQGELEKLAEEGGGAS